MEVRRLETNVLPTNHSEFGGGGEESVEVLGDRQQEPVEEKGAGVLGEHTAVAWPAAASHWAPPHRVPLANESPGFASV